MPTYRLEVDLDHDIFWDRGDAFNGPELSRILAREAAVAMLAIDIGTGEERLLCDRTSQVVGRSWITE